MLRLSCLVAEGVVKLVAEHCEEDVGAPYAITTLNLTAQGAMAVASMLREAADRSEVALEPIHVRLATSEGPDTSQPVLPGFS